MRLRRALPLQALPGLPLLSVLLGGAPSAPAYSGVCSEARAGSYRRLNTPRPNGLPPPLRRAALDSVHSLAACPSHPALPAQ